MSVMSLDKGKLSPSPPLSQPQTSSQHTLRIQRKCANPLPTQKPYPYAVNGDACNSTLSTEIAVPDWYIAGEDVALKNENAIDTTTNTTTNTTNIQTRVNRIYMNMLNT